VFDIEEGKNAGRKKPPSVKKQEGGVSRYGLSLERGRKGSKCGGQFVEKSGPTHIWREGTC